MAKSIIELYKSYFPIEKIKKDLFEYLDEMLSDTFINGEYVFEISEQDSSSITKDVQISRNDTLTIFRVDSSYQFDMDFYFYITIAIGKFKDRNENGFYGVEKCEALLKYNYDFSLYDIEFSYSNMFEID